MTDGKRVKDFLDGLTEPDKSGSEANRQGEHAPESPSPPAEAEVFEIVDLDDTASDASRPEPDSDELVSKEESLEVRHARQVIDASNVPGIDSLSAWGRYRVRGVVESGYKAAVKKKIDGELEILAERVGAEVAAARIEGETRRHQYEEAFASFKQALNERVEAERLAGFYDALVTVCEIADARRREIDESDMADDLKEVLRVEIAERLDRTLEKLRADATDSSQDDAE